MTTANQARAKDPNILAHTTKRPHRRKVACAMQRLLARNRANRQRYANGLPAERSARRAQLNRTKAEARRLILSRRGRRINLQLLLRQRREDGKPRWALVDPLHKPGKDGVNGNYTNDGDVWIKWADGLYYGSYGALIAVGSKARNVSPIGGFPALPPKVRALITDPAVRKRADWVGVLYQPDEWEEPNPDPALVVKWTGVEGHFALAVWGGDRPAIMEFID